MRSLLPSFCPPQLAKSRVIEEIPPRTPLTLEHRKPKIEPLNLRISDRNQRQKNHKGFTRISLIKYPRARSRNTPRKQPREGFKITTKNNREQHNKVLRIHAETSIHTKEVHTRSSLPPNHPTLSQDLTMKLSS
jgi:hypothetical protein